jgi:hypothetical protein
VPSSPLGKIVGCSGGRTGAPHLTLALQPTAYSVRSVRRESGMEECGNTLGVQASNEPLERSIIDHSMV